MQRMVKFRLNRESSEIAVNPARVLYVYHYENGASSVHFSKECFIRVQGSFTEVVQKIEEAMSDNSDIPVGAHVPHGENRPEAN